MELSAIAQQALNRAKDEEASRHYRPLKQKRRENWTPDQEQQLIRLYPDTPMPELERIFSRPDRAIYSKAAALGLKRSAEYMASEHACRLRKGDNVGAEFRFKKGNVTWNKGMKGWSAPGTEATQFKPGQVNGRAAQLLMPIGAERITKDGIRQRKVRSDGPPQARWKSVHEIIWEEHHGPRPKGCLVVFKDRNRSNLTIENLELITRAENCQRNSIHRYPPELKQAIRKLSKLKRAIEDKASEEPT
jgi:hypothetical protein